jgi:hypothetical protein
MRQIRRHTSTPFPRTFLKNPTRWPEPPGQARTRSPSHLPGQTAIGTKALGLLFLRRKVASACGRLAGADLPTFTNTETSIPELKERIAKSIDFIRGLKPTQIDGTEDKEITFKFPSGAERKFTGQALLLNFCLPNFYFHYTTAYNILRHCGVEVGKRDFMGTPVTS